MHLKNSGELRTAWICSGDLIMVLFNLMTSLALFTYPYSTCPLRMSCKAKKYELRSDGFQTWGVQNLLDFINGAQIVRPLGMGARAGLL